MPKFKHLARSLPMAALLVFAGHSHAQQVVTTIKPLQLIASAVMDGVAEPSQLLPDNASPHTFSMRPSDMQLITEADVIFWVGPDMEQFLVRPLQRTDAKIVQLYKDDHDHNHSHAEEHKHDHGHDHAHEKKHDDHGHNHGHENKHDHGHKHDHGKHDHSSHGHDDHHDHDHDAHIWLDPENAAEIAVRMTAELTRIMPEHEAQLMQNLTSFKAKLDELDQAIKAQLKPVQDKGFFVFHDAYGHFVEHFGLNQLGYFTVDPARQPGARHLAQIRQQLDAGNAVCVFSEPQFTSAVVETITRGTDVRHGVLDPLARDFTPSATAYLEYLQQLADAFSDCLEG
jgi:zinc transport system substrate-binding protein